MDVAPNACENAFLRKLAPKRTYNTGLQGSYHSWCHIQQIRLEVVGISSSGLLDEVLIPSEPFAQNRFRPHHCLKQIPRF